jgi:hypothetical protein
MLTKDDIRTLVNVVNADLMQINWKPRFCAIQTFATFDIIQTKERSYCNWHPIDQIFPLTIDIFGCLHKHTNVFLHNCANAIWTLKGPEGPHLSTLVTFVHQKVLFTLQKMQASFILSWVVVLDLATS